MRIIIHISNVQYISPIKYRPFKKKKKNFRKPPHTNEISIFFFKSLPHRGEPASKQ